MSRSVNQVQDILFALILIFHLDGQQSQRLVRVLHEDVGDTIRLFRQIIPITQHHRCRTFADTAINEHVSVYYCADLGDKQVSLLHFAAVELDAVNVNIRPSDCLQGFDYR